MLVMKNYLPLIIIGLFLSSPFALAESKKTVPGWEKDFPHEISHASTSADFSKIAVTQQNLVQLFDSKGEKIFEIKAPSPPTPLLSPDGNYLLIQVKSKQESLRNVYLYNTAGKLLWSKGGLYPAPLFSGNSQYILFSSWLNGGAILVDIKGNVLWKKGPKEIKPDLKSMFLSDDAGIILFNHTGTFERTGKAIKGFDFGWFCDLSSDGTLIANHETVNDQVFLNLYDPSGNRTLQKRIVPSIKQNPEAALALSLNKEISRIALVGNWKGKGYLRLLDLEGNEQWSKGGLPRFIPGDTKAIKLTPRYIRANTFHDNRIYDLAGNLTWKGAIQQYDYFISDDGRFVLIKSPKKIYYLGPSDYLGLGEIPEEAPEPVTGAAEIPAEPPEAVTGPLAPAPATGAILPEGVTGAALPAGVTGTLLLPAGATGPVPEGATAVVPSPEPPFPTEPIGINWTIIIILIILILAGSIVYVVYRSRSGKKIPIPKNPGPELSPWDDE